MEHFATLRGRKGTIRIWLIQELLESLMLRPVFLAAEFSKVACADQVPPRDSRNELGKGLP